LALGSIVNKIFEKKNYLFLERRKQKFCCRKYNFARKSYCS